ncbi:MAG: hypothetical protein ACPGLV_09685 [Bacteroidia bacterium]
MKLLGLGLILFLGFQSFAQVNQVLVLENVCSKRSHTLPIGHHIKVLKKDSTIIKGYLEGFNDSALITSGGVVLIENVNYISFNTRFRKTIANIMLVGTRIIYRVGVLVFVYGINTALLTLDPVYILQSVFSINIFFRGTVLGIGSVPLRIKSRHDIDSDAGWVFKVIEK